MPKSYKKKPLGAWPDDKKHQAVESPEIAGEKSKEGSTPDPEEVESKDTLESAQEMGLYSDVDPNEENQGEVDVAKEEKEDLEEEKQK